MGLMKLMFLISLFYLAMLCNINAGHLGEKCRFKICMPLSPHVWCNPKNQRCECRPENPVILDTHKCGSPKRINERCLYDQECRFLDSNMTCNTNIGQCTCVEGYRFEIFSGSCMTGTDADASYYQRNFPGRIPTFYVYLLYGLCIAILIACLVVVYRRMEDEPEVNIARNLSLAARGEQYRSRLRQMNREIRVEVNPMIDSAPNNLPSYDDTLYSQPPPKYEDVVKNPPCDLTTGYSSPTAPPVSPAHTMSSSGT